MRIAIWLLAAGVLCAATEEGELNGARYRITIPDNWNGSLVMFCHGYSATPVLGDRTPVKFFVARGYAVAQSAYSTGGWAVKEAIEETEALRKEFIRRHGKPKETWITGESMGGHITLATIERFPEAYDGALPLCGAVDAEYRLLLGAFNLLVAFEHYAPGLLPSPGKIPADFRYIPDKAKVVTAKLDEMPKAAATLKQQTNFRRNQDVSNAVVLLTELIGDVQKRAGGNPFDNRAMLYEDAALEKGARRYAADAAALTWLTSRPSLTGKPGKPVVALQNTYDGLVTAVTTNAYGLMTAASGAGAMFVQQYVEGTGHCTFTIDQVGRSFDALLEWTHKGKRPEPGLASSTVAASN